MIRPSGDRDDLEMINDRNPPKKWNFMCFHCMCPRILPIRASTTILCIIFLYVIISKILLHIIIWNMYVIYIKHDLV